MGHPRAYGVVGAGYGDEGKGLMTDYLAATCPGAVVVRTNGGAQAGHTVVTPDGRRHVFHHVGSGALAGNPSHLSRFFVSNPMLFQAEADALAQQGANTTVTADPRGSVTTPYDIMINQIVERVRGHGRHGSCGLGFGETVGRTEAGGHTFLAGDLREEKRVLKEKLVGIRSAWVPARLRALGIGSITEEERELINNEVILDRFIQDCHAFAESVPLRADASLGMTDVVFEGAQGLMLDQDLGAFPHVTRSHTCAINMAAVAREAGFDRIDVVYATRSYVTRHGAGPLTHEVSNLEFADVVDPTNFPNPWQGTIRYAPLDVDLLRSAIEADIKRSTATGMGIQPSLAVSCVDQLHERATVIQANRSQEIAATHIAQAIAAAVGIDASFAGHGPTRANVAPVLKNAA